MPVLTLTAEELRIVEFFLFGADGGPKGLLDWGIVANSNPWQTAREALEQDPTLDVLQWVRDTPQEFPVHGAELAMTWWIFANNGVNITPPNRPPEAAAWIVLMQEWDQSIVRGFNLQPQVERNQQKSVRVKGRSDEVVLPEGDFLAMQRPIYAKVLPLLGA